MYDEYFYSIFQSANLSNKLFFLNKVLLFHRRVRIVQTRWPIESLRSGPFIIGVGARGNKLSLSLFFLISNLKYSIFHICKSNILYNELQARFLRSSNQTRLRSRCYCQTSLSAKVLSKRLLRVGEI